MNVLTRSLNFIRRIPREAWPFAKRFFFATFSQEVWGTNATWRFLTIIGGAPLMMVWVGTQLWYDHTFAPPLAFGDTLVASAYWTTMAVKVAAGALSWVGFVWLCIGLHALGTRFSRTANHLTPRRQAGLS